MRLRFLLKGSFRLEEFVRATQFLLTSKRCYPGFKSIEDPYQVDVERYKMSTHRNLVDINQKGTIKWLFI